MLKKFLTRLCSSGNLVDETSMGVLDLRVGVLMSTDISNGKTLDHPPQSLTAFMMLAGLLPRVSRI